ncbi:MAG: segregation/condensation protein A [Blastocatellia bacterium]|nr:segregation/condensation protein A [Blastocatellia bacterium]
MEVEAIENGSETEPQANGYKVKLEVFEGPLDLLLYLIKKEEIDIYDIPIARITQQYLDYLSLMEQFDVDIASDFLVMAATLIQIKSKMLLPPDPTISGQEEAVEDPRKELVNRLLEHKKFKAAAEMLWTKVQVEQEVFTRALLDIDKENTEIAATVYDLIAAFKTVCDRQREEQEMEIAHEVMTMEQKMEELKALFTDSLEVNISRLFALAKSRTDLIMTFLTILELVKESVVRLIQDRPFGEIIAIKR